MGPFGYQTLVFDWGIGGLSVYREIKRRDPRRRIVYFSDSGTTPYGRMRPLELESRVAQVCQYFLRQEIREIVIACNAASTAAPWLRSRHELRAVRIVDVISSGIRMVKSTSLRRIGVIGGRRTILSRIYQRALSTKRRRVAGRIAQPLSALIERGELNTPLMQETLRSILQPLRRMDGILLACTHYPAVQHLIQPLLPNSRILDPSAMTAEDVVAIRVPELTKGTPDAFLTTGDPNSSRESARLAFGVKIGRFIQIKM